MVGRVKLSEGTVQKNSLWLLLSCRKIITWSLSLNETTTSSIFCIIYALQLLGVVESDLHFYMPIIWYFFFLIFFFSNRRLNCQLLNCSITYYRYNSRTWVRYIQCHGGVRDRRTTHSLLKIVAEYKAPIKRRGAIHWCRTTTMWQALRSVDILAQIALTCTREPWPEDNKRHLLPFYCIIVFAYRFTWWFPSL